MKQILFLIALACCCQSLLAVPAKDADLDKDFQSIENALEKMTQDEEKRELEAELMKFPANEKKDEAKMDAGIEEDFAKELLGIDKSKKDKDKEADAALHAIMKKFDSGDIKIDQLKTSLEDYYKKESKDLIASDIAEENDSGKKCEDARNDCDKYTRYCKSHAKTMKSKCAKTCGFCVKCENKLSESKCKQLGKFKYCEKKKFKAQMKNLCFKECGYCKPSYTPECSKSTFGCCWNKITMKQDKEGSNCPPCDDMYRTACTTFKDDCMKSNIAGQFMRRRCPQTCNVCGNCIDDPAFKEKCPSWAALGWCKNLESTMKALCPGTCKLC